MDVTCVRCGETRGSITSFITFTGALKERIASEVCQPCWAEWLEMQIKVINEYKLHMGEAEHRKVLSEFAERFFRMDGGDGSLGAGPEGGLS